jgi:pyruvate,orthophosphate dikinase
MAKKGPVVLVRPETNPDDIEGMVVAEGILTAIGGRTSHAAVVARGMGKPCVVGCGVLKIDDEAGVLNVDGHTVKEGDYLSIDGFTGEVLLGQVPTLPSEVVRVLRNELPAKESTLFASFKTVMAWADTYRKIKVRANADIPRDAIMARALGAEGIGLCRTEHMFFAPDRLPFMQEMILADTEEDRRKALDKLLPFQKDDFKGLLKEMKGFGVTIRTLDPPLHEFLPKTKEDAACPLQKIGIPTEKIVQRPTNFTSSTPCWATVDAGWGSPIRKSRNASAGHFVRRLRAQEREGQRSAGNHDPSGRERERIERPNRHCSSRGRRRSKKNTA